MSDDSIQTSKEKSIDANKIYHTIADSQVSENESSMEVTDEIHEAEILDCWITSDKNNKKAESLDIKIQLPTSDTMTIKFNKQDIISGELENFLNSQNATLEDIESIIGSTTHVLYDDSEPHSLLYHPDGIENLRDKYCGSWKYQESDTGVRMSGIMFAALELSLLPIVFLPMITSILTNSIILLGLSLILGVLPIVYLVSSLSIHDNYTQKEISL